MTKRPFHSPLFLEHAQLVLNFCRLAESVAPPKAQGWLPKDTTALDAVVPKFSGRKQTLATAMHPFGTTLAVL